jgi:tetratricopeptide (TPR) repeat protein
MINGLDKARWLLLAGVAVALSGCPAEQMGPGPMLVADPPPTEDGRPPGAGLTDLDRGVAYVKKEAWAEAIPHFEQAISAQPGNAEAHYYLALARRMTGDKEKAENGFERAIEVDDKLVDARIHLADLYLLQEPPRPEDAIKVLAPAVKLDPKAADTHELLGRAFAMVKNADKAVEHYEASLRLDDRPQVRFEYSEVLFLLGRKDKSVAQMRKALPGLGKDVERIVVVAHRFGKAQAFADCVKAFDAAIKLDGKEPGYYLHRGLCKHSLKDDEGERADYIKALQIKPTFQPAHYYLGMSWLSAKKRQKAADAFGKAVKLGPKTRVGKKARAQLDGMIKKRRR